MREQSHISEALIREIARYLAAVDVYRDADCEPTWRHELEPPNGDPIGFRLAVYGQAASAAGA